MGELNLFSETTCQNTFNKICDSIGCEGNIPGWPDYFGQSIKNWLLKNGVSQIRTLSLFSGAGGLDIGFSDVGFEIVESVEIEKKFCETLEMNSGAGQRFNNSKVNCIDIREFSAENLGKIDFIIGGPPCQTFSAAGRRANGVLGTTDARGVLFREYVRILKELSPKGFLFENVYGIVGAQNGKAWNEILKSFSDVGYKLFYRILDAADYGVPQHRERLLIVGLKEGGFKFPRPTHGPDSLDNQPFYNAETAIEGVKSKETVESNRLGGRFAGLLDDIPPGLNYSFYTEKMGHPSPIFAWRSKFSDFLYKADPNEPVRTIKANGGAYTGPLHWENRFFTYEEYKRLQTFPDDYKISGNKKIAVKQIGNSVPPQLARMMAISIRNQVFGTKFPFELPLLEEYEELTFRKRKRKLTEIYREKAKQAISVLKNERNILPESHSYYCTINKMFKFNLTSAKESDFKVEVEWGDDLKITVIDTVDECKKSPSEYLIDIQASDEKWTIGVNSVQLDIRTKEHFGYTVAWKAFERELINNNIKADLVQLNGYYQYMPKIFTKVNLANDIPYFSVIRSILSSRTIPAIHNTKELSELWRIDESEVFEAAQYLRSLGYEIRNHKTNPQIPKDCWLIPYIFPTLTPLSVQLWKNL